MYLKVSILIPKNSLILQNEQEKDGQHTRHPSQFIVVSRLLKLYKVNYHCRISAMERSGLCITHS